MNIKVLISCIEIKKYIERVNKGEDKAQCWEEEVVAPYWDMLCCYAPFDLSERKPSVIENVEELEKQCVLLEQLDMETIRKEFERIATILPNYDDDPITVVIFPGNSANRTVNEKQNGVVGTALFGNMFLQVNPFVDGFNDWIYYVFAHEYHHTVWGNYWFMLHAGELENKFIDSLVIDGEADSFAMELFPHLRPEWLFGLSLQETEELWETKYSQIVNEQEVDYTAYMFGNEEQNIPWCAGYAVGYRIVQNYLEMSGRTIVEILETKPEILLGGMSMQYQDVIDCFKEKVLPFVVEKYGLEEYTIDPLASHEGGRNVVFICEKENGQSFVLRISYQNDRSREDYLAELEYVRYLYDNGASVANVITSKDGNFLEEINYGNRTLYICLFEKAKGMQLAENNYRYREGAPLTEYFFNCGKTLGKIHQLSKEYQPVHKRIHFSDKYNMTYIDRLLPEHLSEVKDKIADILATLDKIGKTKDNYGMVHFDYSDGNYHIDFDNGQITVYDFDNSCHAWYMYDLAELWVHGEGWIMFEPDELKRKQFMEDYFVEIVKGYRTETTIEEEMVKKLPLFVMATRIELLVDAFEVERATGENYLDEEDIEEISQCLLEGKIL